VNTGFLGRVRILPILAGALAALVIAVALWCVVLYANQGSLGLYAGRLRSSKSQYLDNSGHVFQSSSYHLGIGTHLWAEAYGIKLGRYYLTLGYYTKIQT
jgi:hypothetical protein